jgi:cytoskeletal protein RodZ
MTQANDNASGQPVQKESRTSLERASRSKTALIYFLSLIIVILMGCLGAEHLGYLRLQQHDNTKSADDLNGQNPANTYATPGATTATSAVTSAAASATVNNPGGNSPNAGSTAPPITTTPATTASEPKQ